jgi:hypothetical protein
MDTFISFVVIILNHVPLVLAFYIPALLGVVLWKEKGGAHRVKAGVVLLLGFGLIVWVKLVFRAFSAVQAAEILGVSAIQISVAVVLAYLTAYKLAD